MRDIGRLAHNEENQALSRGICSLKGSNEPKSTSIDSGGHDPPQNEKAAGAGDVHGLDQSGIYYNSNCFFTHLGDIGKRLLRPKCPVRRNSVKGPIDWPAAMTKPGRRDYYRHLNRFNQQTRFGIQGVIGRNGFLVLGALLSFQKANGELAPSKAAIAYRAQLCVNAVHEVLTHLKNRNVISWVRRSKPGADKFEWVQDTNAYFLNPPSKWIGYRMPEEAPAPEPDTWGARPPDGFPDWYDYEPEGSLGSVLAGLKRAMMEKTTDLRASTPCGDKTPYGSLIPQFCTSR